MDDAYLRRDGTNTATGTINMTGNTLTNVSDPVFDHDVANKLYVDDKTREDCASKVSNTGGIISGNVFISSEGNNDRVLGCTDLGVARSFSIPLGTNTNRLSFEYGRNPVVLETDFGFTVKARNELVCELGSSMEITFYKNVRINSNRITNLPPLELAHEAANKLYVDRTARKILQGYLPNLRSASATVPNDKFGFVVTASSHVNNFFLPIYAFNGVYFRGGGISGEWASNGESRNFWIRIKCPDLVRLWKIALRGRNTNRQRIYSWRLEGSTDGESYTTLLEPPNPSYIGNELEYHLIDTTDRFNIYRLYCLEAESSNPGLSYMQLYVYSE